MGWFTKNKVVGGVNWTILNSPDQLQELDDKSEAKTIMIFKHSTRCSISVMAKNRIESKWTFSEETVEPVYLDLLKHRDISNELAQHYNVQHESPQILLIRNGKCVYSASHNMVDVNNIKDNI